MGSEGTNIQLSIQYKQQKSSCNRTHDQRLGSDRIIYRWNNMFGQSSRNYRDILFMQMYGMQDTMLRLE